MIAALDELRNVLPARFESEDYQARRRAIDEQFRSGNEEALEALSKKAQSQNIALLRTPTGFAMAPMHEGKVVKPEVFNALPEAMRRDVETKIAALEKELGQMLERLPQSDKKRRGPAQRAQRGGGQDCHPRCAVRPARILSATCPRLRPSSRRRATTWCATSACSSPPARKRTPSSSSRSTPRTTRASAATWSTSWPRTATSRLARR